MKSERGTEAPLTAAEVRRILSVCSPRGLLVGGQALAFWADHLQVERPENLLSGVTADADFIGDSALAKDLAKRLGWPWMSRVHSFDGKLPLEDFRTTTALHKVRWPRIVAQVGEKRESLRRLSSRSTRSAK